jgi:hypothetical protein
MGSMYVPMSEEDCIREVVIIKKFRAEIAEKEAQRAREREKERP